MKNNQDIEKAVQQTLNSLDSLQQLEANEYLYAKIKQRMDNTAKVVPMNYNRVMLRLAAVLILFIGINGVSFYVLKHSSVHATQTTSGANAFADAYNLNKNTDSY
ncbi:MAG: hypothetical protein H7289_09555 [Mucilaginibacter sp.]|nr:hypothetical protein [Mucilaginibacter sp.]